MNEIEKVQEVVVGNTSNDLDKIEKGKFSSWCFTSFEIDKPEFSELMRYLCFSPEVCPTSGKAHFQGYF